MKTASTIGPKTVVIGNVQGDGDLAVHGQIEGDVTMEGDVVIEASATIKGSVSARAIKVAGTVEGNLQATDTVAVEPDARVLGDMTTPRVSIAEGAVVRGMVRTDSEQRPRKREAHEAAPVPTHTHRMAPPNRVAPPTRVAPPAPAPSPQPIVHRAVEVTTVLGDPTDPLPKKRDKHRGKRPPEPKVPTLAKGTKGKKKGDKHAR